LPVRSSQPEARSSLQNFTALDRLFTASLIGKCSYGQGDQGLPPAPQGGKMKPTRIVLAIGAAVILAVTVVLAQGMHGHGGPMSHGFEHMLGFYAERLDLTSAQQDQIKAIWAKEKPTVKPLMQQLRQFHSDMNKLGSDGAFDEAKVRALATQQSQTMIELAVQHARIKSEMMQVLTPEQKTKFAELQARHEQRMQRHMHFKHEAPEPPSD